VVIITLRIAKKDVTCGKYTGNHPKNEAEKCVNCEETILNFKMKNIDANHSAFVISYPYYER